jgi:TonB-linked SusC/RagA family outer membrane protein
MNKRITKWKSEWVTCLRCRWREGSLLLLLILLGMVCAVPVCARHGKSSQPVDAGSHAEVFALAPVNQSDRRVSGVVTDESGLPIIGANVLELGVSDRGTVTDASGRFELSVTSSSSVLQVSYIGYVSQEVTVGSRSVFSLMLLEDSKLLDEVIVVGYGTQKKSNLTGAVSTVSAKALASRPISNANLALQGLAAGMNIWQNDGQANSAPAINIRGHTSLSNEGNTGPLILVDNLPTDLSRINPDDIESVTVLKDASAAAIYGARASYGVVLITTKTAKSDRLQVDVNANTAFRTFIDLPDMTTDIAAYMEYRNIFSEQTSGTDWYSPEQIAYAKRRMADHSLPSILHPNDALNPANRNDGWWEYYEITDYGKLLLRENVPTQTYNARVSQKGDRLSYAFSAEYFQQDGMMRYTSDKLQRYNLRGNATYKLTNWWDMGTTLAYTNQVYDRPSYLKEDYHTAEDDQSWNFYRLFQGYPNLPLYNPDGQPSDSGQSIALFIEGGSEIDRISETLASFNTTIHLFEDVWTIKGDASFRFTDARKDKTKLGILSGSRGPGYISSMNPSAASLTDRGSEYIVYNAYTDFHKTFVGKHDVHALLGFNQEYSHWDEMYVRVDNLLTSTLPTINLTNPSSNVEKNQEIEEWALRGAFGRVNYVFNNRYLLEASGRYDGTSRFPKDSRFVFFPSASAGWVLSNESFMSGVNKVLRLSNLKLRGSYGTLGNQNVGAYQYISTMGFNSRTDRLINGSQGSSVTQPGADNSTLTWETVRTVNGAIDLSLFDYRLDLTFDRYARYTEGMLTKSKELPGIFGADPPQSNAADLKTIGFDLTVSWRDQIKNVGGFPLNYSVRFLLSDYTGYVTRFDNPNKRLDDHYEGEKLGQIWGYETLGYFSSDAEAASWADQSAVGNGRGFQAGDLKFRDINGDGYINQGSNTLDDPGDRKVIGNSDPHYTYSLDLGGDWRGFDLRIFMHGVGKRDIYPSEGADGAVFFWGMYTSPWRNMIESNKDNWDNYGDAGYFPRRKADIAGNGELGKAQTRYLQDASFLRIKNITLGYTLPSSLTSRSHINRLRVYVSGENLLTFDHIDIPGNDPERLNGPFYPFTKVYSLGLNINF